MSKRFNTAEIFNSRIENFQKLMKYKIRDILLVSSLYDYYLFEEDGRLYELLRQEYQLLNLSQSPEITHASSAAEALDLCDNGIKFDLIITTMHIEDLHVVSFANELKRSGVTAPIILLAYDNKERKELTTNFDTAVFERIFIWQGDYRLLMGIIKSVEDKFNIENDTKTVGVQTIILVEDNVKFYSSYMPLLYAEVFNQTQRLITEGVNLSHKFLRMRARPKIILCTNYEEAWTYYEKYQDYTLGIVCDINFKKDGQKDPEAGIKFTRAVKEQHKDIPILLQSSNAEFADTAKSLGASFIQKGSTRLLHELHDFIMDNLGFGDFVFCTPDCQVVGRANNLKTLQEQLAIVPDDSILYHSERNHFSNWLKARTEFSLAHSLRPRKVSEFRSVDELRYELINSISKYQEDRKRGVITDFSKDTFDIKNSFARIGGGSLGGKARGLGFINNLIDNYNIRYQFPGIEISVPAGIVIATDIYDYFLVENHLESFALSENDDEAIYKKFVESYKFPPDVISKLRDFLDISREPLAVRSSSLLEDSQYQPFAGVYETYMLPNNNPDDEIRLDELLICIKAVYASTFFKKAKDYMKATAYRLEEEKMAVIIQKLIGAKYDERFYPDFAGVAKSYNFYPASPQKASDGIAMAALGLGKTVVEGGNSVRFCPKYPKHLLQFTSVKETVKNAQQNFFALDLTENLENDYHSLHCAENLVHSYPLSVAEKDYTLANVGSTYSSENEAVYDGLSRKGRRVVTFAPILKHKVFPLADILDMLLELGTWGMGTMVELEYAVNLKVPVGCPKEFSLLQMRPLVINNETEEVNLDIHVEDEMICKSSQVLGNGIVKDLYDAIVVDIEKYDRSKSVLAAAEVALLNTKLVNQKRPYMLIGVGRWGSMDHWLGIPVTWDQIAGAAVIVESGFKDFNVTPSQGSHFFQNITSFRIGYFTVNQAFNQSDFINWDWLKENKSVEELQFVRHIQFDEPVSVKINGHQNAGIILKPGVWK